MFDASANVNVSHGGLALARRCCGEELVRACRHVGRRRRAPAVGTVMGQTRPAWWAGAYTCRGARGQCGAALIACWHGGSPTPFVASLQHGADSNGNSRGNGDGNGTGNSYGSSADSSNGYSAGENNGINTGSNTDSNISGNNGDNVELQKSC